MPCLNEGETLAQCIEKARVGIQRSGVRGEVLVADNGSKDDSVLIAEKLGVRVVHVEKKDTATRCEAEFKPHLEDGSLWATPTRATIFPKWTAS